VDKNSVKISVPAERGEYLPGIITFHAKKGKSIDLAKMRDSLLATRLSGSTGSGVDWLEITATGEGVPGDKETLFKVAGTAQEFVLASEPSSGAVFQRLREALARGERVRSVTGRVEGWKGNFPVLLRALAGQPLKLTDQLTRPVAGPRTVLFVTDFDTVKR
jgi:hypothetical protein